MFNQSWVPGWVLFGVVLSSCVAAGCYMQMPDVEAVYIVEICGLTTVIWMLLSLFLLRMGNPAIWSMLQDAKHEYDMKFAKSAGPALRTIARALGVKSESNDTIVAAFEAKLARGNAAEAKLNDSAIRTEIRRLEAQLAELGGKCQTAQLKLNGIDEKVVERGRELALIEKSIGEGRGESGRLGNELGHLRLDVERARKDAGAARESRTAAETEEAASRERNVLLLAENAQLATRVGELQLSAPALETTVQRLTDEKAAAELALSELDGAKLVAQNALRESTDAKNAIDEQLIPLRELERKLQLEVAGLESAAGASRITLEQLEATTTSVQRELALARSSYAELDERSRALRSNIEAAEQELTRVTTEQQQVDQRLVQTAAEAQAAESQFAELRGEIERQLETLRQTAATEQAAFEQLQMQHRELNEAVAALLSEKAHLVDWIIGLRKTRVAKLAQLRYIHELTDSATHHLDEVNKWVVHYDAEIAAAQLAMQNREANEQAAADAVAKLATTEAAWKALSTQVDARQASQQFLRPQGKVRHMPSRPRNTGDGPCNRCAELTQAVASISTERDNIQSERDQLRLALGSKILLALSCLESDSATSE